MSIADIYANPQNDVYNVKTHASGPKGSLPLTGDMGKGAGHVEQAEAAAVFRWPFALGRQAYLRF